MRPRRVLCCAALRVCGCAALQTDPSAIMAFYNVKCTSEIKIKVQEATALLGSDEQLGRCETPLFEKVIQSCGYNPLSGTLARLREPRALSRRAVAVRALACKWARVLRRCFDAHALPPSRVGIMCHWCQQAAMAEAHSASCCRLPRHVVCALLSQGLHMGSGMGRARWGATTDPPPLPDTDRVAIAAHHVGAGKTNYGFFYGWLSLGDTGGEAAEPKVGRAVGPGAASAAAPERGTAG